MAFEFRFPDVGEGIAEGRLIKWLVHEGDTIKEDQPVAEIETDKSVVELPTPKGGKVKQLLYKEKDIIPVGKTLMIIDDGTAGPPTTIQKHPVQQSSNPSPRSISPPSSTGIKALPLVRKAAKDKGINLATIAGHGKDGRILLADLGTPTPIKASAQPTTDILASPSIRKLARELGIDIATVNGTGKNGSITIDDLNNATKPKTAITTEHLHATPPITSTGNVTRTPMSMFRLAIANKMTESANNIPAVTHLDTADVTDLVALREKEKEILAKRGIKLTYLPFFMKAAVIALKNNPNFNAELDMNRREIILKNYYHLGLAIDTPQGLIVAAIPDADKKSITELASELADKAERARTGKLQPSEMHGSTFTITSIGSIGGEGFTPLINYPEVGILGIGTIKDKPAVKNGKVVPRKLVTLSLTYDHRLIDGADASRFLSTIIAHIEDPSLLFLEMM